MPVSPAGAVIGGGVLPDPELRVGDAGRLKYKPAEGKLFVDGLDPEDVIQGAIGDCYFLSTLAAIADRHSQLVEQMMKVNEDGTVSVTFYQRDRWNSPLRPVEIRVDGDLPSTSFSRPYARSADSRELWVSILEKAYAQWQGGYQAIVGGSARQVMEAITGWSPDFAWNAAAGPDALFERLQAATAAGSLVTAATHIDAAGVSYAGTGLVSQHVYTVLGVEERDGTGWVRLRNPHGNGEPAGDGIDDGVFDLPVEKFVQLFAITCMAAPGSGAKPPPLAPLPPAPDKKASEAERVLFAWLREAAAEAGLDAEALLEEYAAVAADPGNPYGRGGALAAMLMRMPRNLPRLEAMPTLDSLLGAGLLSRANALPVLAALREHRAPYNISER
jgi:hypothetical protein